MLYPLSYEGAAPEVTCQRLPTGRRGAAPTGATGAISIAAVASAPAPVFGGAAAAGRAPVAAACPTPRPPSVQYRARVGGSGDLNTQPRAAMFAI
jgi:hypothetical protein